MTDRRQIGTSVFCLRSCRCPVAPEVVWQIGRPPHQSEIWYGGSIPIRWNLGSWFSEKNH